LLNIDYLVWEIFNKSMLNIRCSMMGGAAAFGLQLAAGNQELACDQPSTINHQRSTINKNSAGLPEH
jgi:hypothetical protein